MPELAYIWTPSQAIGFHFRQKNAGGETQEPPADRPHGSWRVLCRKAGHRDADARRTIRDNAAEAIIVLMAMLLGVGSLATVDLERDNKSKTA